MNRIVGRRFGKLTVIDYCMDSNNSSPKVVCKCDCGNIVNVFATNLYAGRTISCGCHKRTHGESDSSLYNRFAWLKHVGCDFESYEDYKRWLEDNGVTSECDFRVKRIDKSKPFSKENCQVVIKNAI